MENASGEATLAVRGTFQVMTLAIELLAAYLGFFFAIATTVSTLNPALVEAIAGRSVTPPRDILAL